MNFQNIISRQGTNSYKWEFVDRNPQLDPVLPLWVADMDFAAPKSVQIALVQRMQHPIYGYTLVPKEYFQSVVEWSERVHGIKLQTRDFLLAPGVMPSMAMALRAFTDKGDTVLSFNPVYGPFGALVTRNERSLLELDLQVQEGYWTLPLEALSAKLASLEGSPGMPKLLLWCNPHNPTGRVWTRTELLQLAELCLRYGLMIFSDEIHGDLIHPGSKWTSMSELCSELPALEEQLIVFSGPNKTFNLAGLGLSHVWCKHTGNRLKIHNALQANFFEAPNLAAITAAYAAYHVENEDWLKEMLAASRLNYALLKAWVGEIQVELELGNTYLSPLEATYLAWWNCQCLLDVLGIEEKSWYRAIECEARVKLGWGELFGAVGKGHLRFNLAMPSTLFEDALTRLKAWILSQYSVRV